MAFLEHWNAVGLPISDGVRQTLEERFDHAGLHFDELARSCSRYPSTEFVHLVDTTIHASDHEYSVGLWRCRLDSVDGWALGELDTDGDE